MKTETRIYEVTDATTTDAAPRLVEATNQAQAVKHCAKRYAASVASAKRVAELVGAGTKVEKAGAE